MQLQNLQRAIDLNKQRENYLDKMDILENWAAIGIHNGGSSLKFNRNEDCPHELDRPTKNFIQESMAIYRQKIADIDKEIESL